MSENSLGNTIVTQVGIVVKDIEKTLDQWVEIFGLPERPNVIVTDTEDKAHTRYHGAPSQARPKLAFIPMGQVTVELIEPDGNPSTWQEHLDRFGDSVHHIAFQVKGTGQVVASLSAKGLQMDQQGDYTGGMYTYINSLKQLGVNLELLENF